MSSDASTAKAAPAIPERRYSGIQVALHWIIALIIIGMIPVGLVMTRLDPSTLANLLYELHKSFGLIVFGLVVIRIGTRFALGVPPLAPNMPHWQIRAARISHAALYVLIILVPLTGWAATSACCAPVNSVLGDPADTAHRGRLRDRWPDLPAAQHLHHGADRAGAAAFPGSALPPLRAEGWHPAQDDAGCERGGEALSRTLLPSDGQGEEILMPDDATHARAHARLAP